MSSNLDVETKSELASLDPLAGLLAGDMKAVNAMILERLAGDVPLIPELAGHLIAAGGKRIIRPMMTSPGRALPAARRTQSGWQQRSNLSIRQPCCMMM